MFRLPLPSIIGLIFSYLGGVYGGETCFVYLKNGINFGCFPFSNSQFWESSGPFGLRMYSCAFVINEEVLNLDENAGEIVE